MKIMKMMERKKRKKKRKKKKKKKKQKLIKEEEKDLKVHLRKNPLKVRIKEENNQYSKKN